MPRPGGRVDFGETPAAAVIREGLELCPPGAPVSSGNLCTQERTQGQASMAVYGVAPR
ncbi:NUDIX hydrolase [Oceanicella sp. SM1341]|uniref:NUDIX hydrolase n=1 Tax=Oceanicella sp. SM1341 TaxID=1548889 RepID=UPI001300574D|nr:hypothetical protein [Oceanicella sp. SM1341]